MQRYKTSAEDVVSMRTSVKVSESKDVCQHETSMIKYIEAMDKVVELIDEKNIVIDMIDEKLALLHTHNGEEMLRERYINYLTVESIADKYKYSRQGAHKIINRAMKELDELVAPILPSEFRSMLADRKAQSKQA